MIPSHRSALPRDAQSELEQYLRRVRAALSSHSSVDADEVERDIRSHIDAELAESPEPVTVQRLQEVLDRLGSPGQWVPTDELPLWRRLLIKLRSGPEDWRLAYLTFALFVTAAIFFFIAPALLLASFLVARASLAMLEGEAEPIGARRWLLYPPLVVVYVAIALAVIFLPPAPILLAADPMLRDDAAGWLPAPFWLGWAFALAAGAGLWWVLLGLLLVRYALGARALFRPFAEWLDRRHGLRLAYFGCAVGLVGAGGLAALIWMSARLAP